MRKTTEAQDYAAEVATWPVADRLLLLGQLACAEAAARIQAQELAACHEAADVDVVRRALAPPMHSARRARDRIAENYDAAASTVRRVA